MYSYQRIVLFFLSVYSASAFAPSLGGNNAAPILRSCQRRSVSLGAATTDTWVYKDDPEDKLTCFTTANLQPQRVEKAPPPTPSIPELYLIPRHSSEQAEKARLCLSNIELYIGRIAMLAAILLLGIEVATGASLPDQLARYFG